MYNNEVPKKEELPSTKQLLRSTLIALVVALVLLATVVLPAEYATDPTGIGRLLGLTQMGEIKMTLAEEAKRDREASAAQPDMTTQPAVRPEEAKPSAPDEQTATGATRSDTMTVTLKPGQGVEIKLDMRKGARASYEWTTDSGGLNFDIHGDNTSKAFISYKKGTNATQDSGEIIADFDGSHGWFWRNRTSGDVSLTLKTNGEYTEINRVV